MEEKVKFVECTKEEYDALFDSEGEQQNDD